MTRKDYIAIAAALKAANQQPGGATATNLVLSLCDHMAKDNPRFNQGKFMEAAGFSFESGLGWVAAYGR